MVIVLYRREITIHHDQRLIERWHEWSFAPVVAHGKETPREWKDRDGVIRVTLVNRLEVSAGSISVVVPAGSKIVERSSGLRLSYYGDVEGVTAETVWYIAHNRLKTGFRLEAASAASSPA